MLSVRRATSAETVPASYHPDFYPRPPRGGRLCDAANVQTALSISIHALREEGDITNPLDGVSSCTFLSTPSARRATICDRGCFPPPEISIHALREEGDWLRSMASTPTLHFYPRPPRGGRRT